MTSTVEMSAVLYQEPPRAWSTQNDSSFGDSVKSAALNIFEQRIAIQDLHHNGRDVVRIHLPRPLMFALGALHFAVLRTSKNKGVAKRRGSRPMIENAITGMAGQIALVLWLRSLGYEARMLPLSPRPDPGYDVIMERGAAQATFEVKTSLFQDRGSELVRQGDRMPVTGARARADLYVWAIAAPDIFTATEPYIDVFAVVPAGAVCARAGRGKIAGIRLLSIATEFSPSWFSGLFRAPGSTRVDTPIPSPPLYDSVEQLTADSWARSLLFGGLDVLAADELISRSAITRLANAALHDVLWQSDEYAHDMAASAVALPYQGFGEH